MPDTGLDEREELVLSCLPALSPLQRQVVLLRLQQGLSYEDIALIVGEKVSYVGNLLHHAVKILSEEVKRKEGGTHGLSL
jgi:RNA polymerase sigma-70 factor (ECF subfamily)